MLLGQTVWPLRSFAAILDLEYAIAARNLKEPKLLTESTVETMFRELMNTPERTEEVFEKAEDLLEEELRPESPLRHRLNVELEELRSLATKT